MEWPEWWEWDIKLSAHVELRMEERDITEIDLRRMLESASSYQQDVLEGRWLIWATHRRRRWDVIVEPDYRRRVLVVITAYQS